MEACGPRLHKVLIRLWRVLILMTIGCCNRSSTQTSAPTTQASPVTKTLKATMEEARILLWSAPAWTALEMKSPECDLLLDATKRLSQMPTTELREFVIVFAKECEDSENRDHWLEQVSKVYILNRVAFEVPSQYSTRANSNVLFGGWAGPPIENGIANIRWPLEYLPDGSIKIIGEFGGYMGPTYRALEEFDYFRSRFPRRQFEKE